MPSFPNLRPANLCLDLGAIVLGSHVPGLVHLRPDTSDPMPVTMQTFAVALPGARYGWRLDGITTIASWLVEDAVGPPVLAGSPACITSVVRRADTALPFWLPAR